MSFRESNFAHCLMKYAFLTACGQHTLSVMQSIIRGKQRPHNGNTPDGSYTIWDFPIRMGQMCFHNVSLKLMRVM